MRFVNFNTESVYSSIMRFSLLIKKKSKFCAQNIYYFDEYNEYHHPPLWSLVRMREDSLYKSQTKSKFSLVPLPKYKDRELVI